MTDEDVNKFRGVIKEELQSVTKNLDTLWDQVVKVTEDIEGVKETLELHTTVLQRIEEKVEHNAENTKKVDKRLTEAESHLGIVPPPELAL